MKNTMNWNFDNSYSRLSNAFKEHIEPIAVKNPELVLMNKDLVEELNLDFSKIDKNESKHPETDLLLQQYRPRICHLTR